jgi:hypothetical protein
MFQLYGYGLQSLCHESTGDDPLLSNCAGCHVGAGLRAHHAANDVTTCYTAEYHGPEPLLMGWRLREFSAFHRRFKSAFLR